MYQAYIHTKEDARMIDASAIAKYHIPSLILMEHAAIESTKIIEQSAISNSFTILCGPGNNGGDGLAIARLLHNDGFDVDIYCVEEDKMSEDEKIQFQMIKELKLPYTHQLIDHFEPTIIDCLFGNGLTRALSGEYEQLIDTVNTQNKQVISIDMPSGIHATTGKKLGSAIKAHITISLDCFKYGQFLQDGPTYCQQLYLVDIGIPQILHEQCKEKTIIINQDMIKLPKRDKHSHKGTFGKALMIGGSKNMHGALHLAASSCYRSGIGTLTLMVPESIGDILAYKDDFYMLLRSSETDGLFDEGSLEMLKDQIKNYSIISIGNGMQKTKITQSMVKLLLESDKPLVIDADAIWACNDNIELLDRDAMTIITPHIKEMSDLTGIPVSKILQDPITCARDFTKKYSNCVLILKSSITIISYRDEVYILDAPNANLAKGGSGDILCGIIVAMLGQSKNGLQSAICATYIHSQSAIMDKDSANVMPNDIIENIGNTLKGLRSK